MIVGVYIMSDIRKGTVKIREIITKGLFKKYNIYGGSLKGVPGIYGYSIKQELKKEYHKGDEVKVNYWIYMGGKKDDYDEQMEFEIIEE